MVFVQSGETVGLDLQFSEAEFMRTSQVLFNVEASRFKHHRHL